LITLFLLLGTTILQKEGLRVAKSVTTRVPTSRPNHFKPTGYLVLIQQMEVPWILIVLLVQLSILNSWTALVFLSVYGQFRTIMNKLAMLLDKNKATQGLSNCS
jgi:hypothetical protein